MAKIVLILGTGRDNSNSKKVFTFMHKTLEAAGHIVDTITTSEYVAEPKTMRVGREMQGTSWSTTMKVAQGLVIVCPEYNHGYPGELKLLLDQLYNEYKGKPVLLCGVSDGGFGGVRAVENLLPVLVTLGLRPLRKGIYFSNADKIFNESGALTNDSVKRQVASMVEAFNNELPGDKT